MDKETRSTIERSTQRARKLLEEDFAAQLEGDFDVYRDGEVAAKAGKHLSNAEVFQRERIVAAIEHKRAAGMSGGDSVRDYLRDAAFTTLNRFVALKMLEARDLVQECITKGEQSAGYREFCGMAPGLPLLPDSAGYRLYIESVFDELSIEVRVLFDRRDVSSVLWPKRATFEQLLEVLNATELAAVWSEDETIGWVYQFFNGQDERRKMREESQTPRNGRELAVRNQFFTPRYVVQFLTDNTLGRIWYEMRGAETVLADKCEYMVRKPGEEFAPRAKKDPRDLRVLDPACGSGHFLLYAFDLLLPIYEEAYADPESPNSEATGKTLAEDYPSLEALRNALPRLVLAHNLHGVDIDPRCAQIAQLALWMRAQKAYRDFGIARGERAQIRRSNIVVAEPLVADEQIAKEFVAKLRDAELGRVFMSLVESLNLAGELGMLLSIDQLVENPTVRGRTRGLFAPSEDRIRMALYGFFRDRMDLATTRRRLFVDDALQGLGLVEVSTKRFDVVVMNPPFGEPTPRAEAVLREMKSDGWKDIYAGFFELAERLTGCAGVVGAITSSQYFHTRQLRSLRGNWVTKRRVRCLVELGAGVLDGAAVQTALAVLAAPKSGDLLYSDLFDETDKEYKLGTAVRDDKFSRLSFEDLELVPGTPFCLHASPKILHQWRLDTAFDPTSGTVATGNHTFDDERFLRLRYEVCAEGIGKEWRVFEKGGEYQPFFSAPRLLIQWKEDGAELRALNVAKYGSDAQVMQSSKFWGKRGICYTHVSSVGFSPRILPCGVIFSSESIGVFPKKFGADGEARLLAVLAFLASTAAQELVWVFGRFRKIENRAVSGLPISFRRLDPLLPQLTGLARRGIELLIAIEALDETSSVFRSPDFVVDGSATGSNRQRLAQELEVLYEELDASVETMLEIGNEDIRAPRRASLVSKFALERIALDPEERAADAIMWSVGRLFGRWADHRHLLSAPDLLHSEIPVTPPAAPQEAASSERAILVDDEGHQDDIGALVLSCLDEDGARPLAAMISGVLPCEEPRLWLRTRFFEHHVRRYSAFKRKAPIYWQLATPSASYSVWLYIHAFNKDTLFRVQSDYVAPKLAHEERSFESLTSDLRDGATSAQRKQLAAREVFVEELRAFLDEVKRVAPLWNPNLDDGVTINFAPLWRLVPHNKAWQRELKSTWDALCDGKYDWAHLAMHLWPERVVLKCAKDRSLAIAHRLEDVFWVETADGKWTARKAPTRSVDDLLRERTSPAVKSALKSLLEAPALSGKSTARKGGGRRNGNFAAAPEDLPAFAESAWARPHIMERGEIQAAILAVLKANGAPMARDEARLAALLCLEPHLLIPQLDATDKKTWLRFVGADGKKSITASIGNTIQEWGSALSGLRGRGRLDESLRQNTWAIGAGADAIDTRGWPEGRAGFVIDVLRRRQAVTQLETIIRKLPPPVQQWFANAA